MTRHFAFRNQLKNEFLMDFVFASNFQFNSQGKQSHSPFCKQLPIKFQITSLFAIKFQLISKWIPKELPVRNAIKQQLNSQPIPLRKQFPTKLLMNFLFADKFQFNFQ